jgi:hypothetical protein
MTKLGHFRPIGGSALGPPRLLSGLSPTLRNPLPTEALGRCFRFVRLNKAEHHEVAVITPQGVRGSPGLGWAFASPQRP